MSSIIVTRPQALSLFFHICTYLSLIFRPSTYSDVHCMFYSQYLGLSQFCESRISFGNWRFYWINVYTWMCSWTLSINLSLEDFNFALMSGWSRLFNSTHQIHKILIVVPKSHFELLKGCHSLRGVLERYSPPK